MTKLIAALLAGSALTAVADAASAQTYPARPIQVIVPYAAGGGTDISARITADVFQRVVPGSTMIVRNQPGGGGAIGTSAALHGRADGYTLGIGAQGPLALLPHYGGIDYDLDDVEFIALMARNLQVVVACSGAPFSAYEEFVEHAEANPGGVQIGNSGAGGANHIAVEAYAEAAGLEFRNVPFGGASEALAACAGGHIDAMVATPAEALPHIQSGNATPIFIMEEERIDILPDVPTAVEHGLDFTWSSWRGVIGPKGMPEEVLATLREGFESALTDEEFVRRMEELGDFVEYRDAEAYEALARSDSQTAEQVIRDLGMYGMNQ